MKAKLISVVVLALLLNGVSVGQLTSLTEQVITAEDETTGLVAGDFDRDNDLDLIVANRGNGTLNLLLNNGLGIFGVSAFNATAGNSIVIGDRPFAVIAVDLNLDGILDLAAVLEGTDEIITAGGLANGQFSLAQLRPVGDSPRSIAAGDFDADGFPDLAASNENSDSVTVHFNNKQGLFETSTDATVDTGMGNRPQPKAVAAGDFNNDGAADLAVACFARNTVVIRLSGANGSFGDIQEFTVGGDPFALQIGRVNADANLDIVVANSRDDSVSVLLGEGDGSFVVSGPFAVGNRPEAVGLADFNSDGFLDLATANRESDDVTILLGRGNGTFATGATLTAGSGPSGIAVGDFNRDGTPDVAVANQENDTVSVRLVLSADDAIPGLTDDLPLMTDCGAGCGPMGMAPLMFTLLGMVGMKRRYGR